jgi:protein-S-isoprenylcysteine O-methyltransferase Ste14
MTPEPALDRVGITGLTVRFILRETLGSLSLGLFLFWPAGRLDWGWAWGLIGLTIAWSLGTLIAMLRTNPALIAERLGPRKGGKSWDMAIMGAIGINTIARCLVAGFDQRYGWSSGIDWMGQSIAALAVALGYGLVVWATASNAYFSMIVRIQGERGHQVASGGPYRLVRHPAYVAGIFLELSIPLLLGSWWALMPGGLNALLFVIRTALEDRTLQAELPGYAEFAQTTRYRLIPGVW